MRFFANAELQLLVEQPLSRAGIARIDAPRGTSVPIEVRFVRNGAAYDPDPPYTGGALTAGYWYKIVVHSAGDFSNVASNWNGAANTAGSYFLATGTTPTSWGGDTLRRCSSQGVLFSLRWTLKENGQYGSGSLASLVGGGASDVLPNFAKFGANGTTIFKGVANYNTVELNNLLSIPGDATNPQKIQTQLMAELSWEGPEASKANWVPHYLRNDLYKIGEGTPVDAMPGYVSSLNTLTGPVQVVDGFGVPWPFDPVTGRIAISASGGSGSIADSRLLGRGQGSGAGAAQQLSLGSNLTLTGTVLSATGGAPGGSTGMVQFHDGTTFRGVAAFNFQEASGTLGAPTLSFSSACSGPDGFGFSSPGGNTKISGQTATWFLNTDIIAGGAGGTINLATQTFSGTWSGLVPSPLPANQGGTGQTAYTVGALLYADTTTTLAKLAAGATGKVLQSVNTNTAPTWSIFTFAGSAVLYTFPTSACTLAATNLAQTFSGVQTFSGSIALTGTSFACTTAGATINLSPTGGGTVAISPSGTLTMNVGSTVTVTSPSGISLTTTGAGASTLTSAAATNLTATSSGSVTITTVNGAMTITCGAGTPGAINNMKIGDVTRASAAFTTLAWNGTAQMEENAPITMPASLSGDGKFSGITDTGVAGESIAFGDLVYFKSDGKWWKTDADATATAGAVKLAMSVSAGTVAAAGALNIMHYGKIRATSKFPTMTVGAAQYVDTASGGGTHGAGRIVATQPSGTDDVIRMIGHALTTDSIFFNPSNDYLAHT